MGITDGDALILGADLGKVGAIRGDIPAAIMGALVDAVGADGTVMTVAFTKSFLFEEPDEDVVFDADTPSVSGAVSKLFLRHPRAVRSRHPTNSFVAIGRLADDFLAGHDETSSSYLPIGRLVDANGKMLLIGCADDRNGIQAIHYAQEALGLTRRSLLCNRYRAYFRKGGRRELFVRPDVGGCSRGFHKAYDPLVLGGLLRTGRFGDAYCVIVEARPAVDLVKGILEANPRAFLCDDPGCFTCRATWYFNKRDMPLYWLRNATRLAPRLLGHLKGSLAGRIPRRRG